MNCHITTRAAALVAERLVAFVAGCICVACAGAILFEDVILHDAPIQLPHLLTAGILSIALLAGHLRAKAWGEGRIPSAAQFLVLFLAGSALVVYLSTGKQAEHTFQSQAEADFAAEERARIRPLLAEAEAMLSGAAKAIQKQCVEGKATKKQCDGLRATHGIYEGSVNGHKATLEKLGAPKPVAPEAESFASIAAVFGFDKAKVKAGAILVVPFIRTVLFELGALWCLGSAFGPLPRKETKPATQATVAERRPITPAEQSDFGGDDTDAARQLGIGGEPGTGTWGNSGKGGQGAVGTRQPKRPQGGGGRQAFEADVLTRLALGQTIESQDELAAAHGVHKGVVSKWLKDMRERDLIPNAQRVGRRHRLAVTA